MTRPCLRADTDAHAELRAWLEYVAQTAIDWLDALDAQDADLEDDEREDDAEGLGAPTHPFIPQLRKQR
ncbi:MAG TPA: hypothetical protein VMU59_04200 [Caulobacteraceae bacterium]|nr:hypothetical protein [Caulobacteraceae bacterium]